MKIIDPDAMAATLRRANSKPEGPKTANAVREFDAYFLAQILKSAQAEGEEHMLDGGSAGRMYRDQFFDEMARFVAKQGGFGVTEQVKQMMEDKAGESSERSAEDQS